MKRIVKKLSFEQKMKAVDWLRTQKKDILESKPKRDYLGKLVQKELKFQFPPTAKTTADLLEAAGIKYVPKGSRAGSAESLEEIKAILGIMAKEIIKLGDELGTHISPELILLEESLNA